MRTLRKSHFLAIVAADVGTKQVPALKGSLPLEFFLEKATSLPTMITIGACVNEK